MLRSTFRVLASSAIAITLLTGCTEPKKTTTAAPAPASVPASAPVSVPASPSAAGQDAASKEACTALLAAIKQSDKRVADAEKIGGPAGHIAVGTAYLAGSAALSAGSFGANDKVRDAAGKVGDEMAALDEAWQKDPNKKPSKDALNSAVAELKAACTAG